MGEFDLLERKYGRSKGDEFELLARKYGKKKPARAARKLVARSANLTPVTATIGRQRKITEPAQLAHAALVNNLTRQEFEDLVKTEFPATFGYEGLAKKARAEFQKQLDVASRKRARGATIVEAGRAVGAGMEFLTKPAKKAVRRYAPLPLQTKRVQQNIEDVIGIAPYLATGPIGHAAFLSQVPSLFVPQEGAGAKGESAIPARELLKEAAYRITHPRETIERGKVAQTALDAFLLANVGKRFIPARAPESGPVITERPFTMPETTYAPAGGAQLPLTTEGPFRIPAQAGGIRALGRMRMPEPAPKVAPKPVASIEVAPVKPVAAPKPPAKPRVLGKKAGVVKKAGISKKAGAVPEVPLYSAAARMTGKDRLRAEKASRVVALQELAAQGHTKVRVGNTVQTVDSALTKAKAGLPPASIPLGNAENARVAKAAKEWKITGRKGKTAIEWTDVSGNRIRVETRPKTKTGTGGKRYVVHRPDPTLGTYGALTLKDAQDWVKAKAQALPPEPTAPAGVEPTGLKGKTGIGGSQRGAIGYGAPRPQIMRDIRTSAFVSQDVAPALQTIREGITDAAGRTVRAIAPASYGEGGRVALSIRQHKGAYEHYRDANFASQEKVRQAWEKISEPDRLDFIDAIETGNVESLPADLRVTARSYSARNEGAYQRASVALKKINRSLGHVDNYFSHFWEKPDQATTVLQQIMGRKPLEGKATMLRQRRIPTTREGIEFGLKPLTTNPEEVVLMHEAQAGRIEMTANVLADLKNQGLSKYVPYKKRPPQGWQPIQSGLAKTQWGQYYAEPSAANVLNNYLSEGLWRNAAFRGVRVVGNLATQSQLGLSAFHAMFTAEDVGLTHFAMGLTGLAEGRFRQGITNVAKGLTPLGVVENLALGNRLYKGYFHGSVDPAILTVLKRVEQAGGRAKMHQFYQGFGQGLTHKTAVQSFLTALRGKNVIGTALRAPAAVVEYAARPVMEWLVPRQKLGVFAKLSENELARFPNATEVEKVAIVQRVWDSVDNRLGQLVYDNLFWNRTMKDMGMLSTRSLGWNLGTLRELGGGALDMITMAERLKRGGWKGAITPRQMYAIALPIYVGLQGATITYLVTGKGPSELLDYFTPKTGGTKKDGTPERVQLATYMRDVMAWWKQGAKTTLTHKLNPAIGEFIDWVQNEDWKHDPIRYVDDPLVKQVSQLFTHLASTVMPIGLQNLAKKSSTTIKVGGFFGVTSAPRYLTESPAMKKLWSYLPDFRPVVTTSEDAAALAKKREAKTPDPVGSAQRAFKRLTPAQKAIVLKLATPEERALLGNSGLGRVRPVQRFRALPGSFITRTPARKRS